ncbi:MAG TPA: Clp protease N-terminal domain-containing protein [Candidatus Acidoferrum sp.]|nr:Clp protease N-terminal domain-containing protein [Candidatus Acidoferrum sp.]
MFERYTEKARRVIFFARYEASQYGSPYIETEHLLLGLLREDRTLMTRVLGEVNVEAGIRKEIEAHITVRERISTSVEVPLTQESKKVLNLAAEEAERLAHRHIGTEHLLLGMLRVEGSLAANILQGRNVRLVTAREEIAKVSPAKQRNAKPRSVKKAIVTLDSFFAELRSHKSEELLTFFTENAEFVDVFGKRWNLESICNEFETLFAPYAKKNATYIVEKTFADTKDFLVVTVLWKNAILASMERVWMHRMSVVLVPQGDDWAILLAQVTPVQPK